MIQSESATVILKDHRTDGIRKRPAILIVRNLDVYQVAIDRSNTAFRASIAPCGIAFPGRWIWPGGSGFCFL